MNINGVRNIKHPQVKQSQMLIVIMSNLGPGEEMKVPSVLFGRDGGDHWSKCFLHYQLSGWFHLTVTRKGSRDI